MPRYNITMPEELWERIGDSAPAGNRSYFIREALEAALHSDPTFPVEVRNIGVGEDGSIHATGEDAAYVEHRPPPPRAPARRCELDCGRPVPTSLKVSRCQCGGRLVEG